MLWCCFHVSDGQHYYSSPWVCLRTLCVHFISWLIKGLPMLFEADNYLQLQNLPSAAYLPSFSSCLYWSALLKFANRRVYAARQLSYWNSWGNVDTVCLSILTCAPSDLVHLTWPYSYFLSSLSLLRVCLARPCYCSVRKTFTEIIQHH